MKQIIFLKKHKFNQLCLKLKELNIDIKEGNYEIGCCLDLEEKILYPLNVTCMCCFFNKNTNMILTHLFGSIIKKEGGKTDGKSIDRRR